MLARQMAAPNSPQWFNTGLHYAYGLSGPAQGHYYVDPKSREVVKSTNAFEHPQPHACFIQSVDDDLVNDNGIIDLWVREARLFKYGSGTGTNFSRLRGDGEGLSGGGRSSGQPFAAMVSATPAVSSERPRALSLEFRACLLPSLRLRATRKTAGPDVAKQRAVGLPGVRSSAESIERSAPRTHGTHRRTRQSRISALHSSGSCARRT